MIAITERKDGCVLPVRAQPGARKPGILGEQAGALKVAVTAPPEDGKANLALVKVLCDVLGLKRSQVFLGSGQFNREKKFVICGITRKELAARIARLLGET